MSDKLKKLTGKNPNDFEPVAYSLINNPDTELFKELVDNDEFLFDFVKNNVVNRMAKNCNSSNYKNLLKFLKFYSPSYEDFIISVLVEYSDEDLTDEMLELIANGIEDEKIYCAKYFSIVQDPLALDYLKEYAYSSNSYLSSNCASALAAFGQTDEYEKAILKLQSNDDFEVLSAVSFLISYGDKKCVPFIIDAMKKSNMAENIAIELPYIVDFFEYVKNSQSEGLYLLNLIINGLGDISSLSQVYDFRLYDVFSYLSSNINSASAVVLLNSIDKFNTLTENDEYLFDVSKDVKQEITDIKTLLSKIDKNILYSKISAELRPDSLFVYTALDFVQDPSVVRNLLLCENQTIVLKSVEVLKRLNALTDNDKKNALSVVNNEDIKNVINAI